MIFINNNKNIESEYNMSNKIYISDKYGVNPTIPICFFCNNPKNEIALLGRLRNDIEAPKNLVLNKEPCDTCKKYMEIGVMLVSVRDNETDKENPYRTGSIAVVKKEAAKKMFKCFDNENNEARFAFVEDSVWDEFGLPRGNI